MNYYIYIGEIYDNTGIYIAHVAKLVAVSLKSALHIRIVYVHASIKIGVRY